MLINSYRFAAASPTGDPLFSNVSLLLHGNGTNGSTTITDNSPTPKTVTAFGNAKISTAIADPFGNSTRGVLAFDGTGDFLTIPASSGFVFAADYTLEAWIYPIATTFGIFATGGGGSRDQFVFFNGTCFWDYLSTAGRPGFDNVIRTQDLNKWAHIAVSRIGASSSIFRNGVSLDNWTSASQIGSLNTANVGRRADGLYQANGYIADLRVTKSCRYTANFTPPTAPFPDS